MCKVFESVRTGRSESRNRLNLKQANELSLFLCEFCVQFIKFNYSNGRFPWSTVVSRRSADLYYKYLHALEAYCLYELSPKMMTMRRGCVRVLQANGRKS